MADELLDRASYNEKWDGRGMAYVPLDPVPIPLEIVLSTERADVDVATYEVLRWKLWGINIEHADTIKRASGSPVIVFMDDFATSLLTAGGDNLVCSPTIQYFTGLTDLVVKWTLENRGRNPGIFEGDIFLQNDPYIGTAHQIDTEIFGPVFWEGKIVCWVFNSCHMGDIGGNTPGSFCVTARDIYDEPLPIPPVKLVRGGVLQDDVAEMFCRQSRQPEMIQLQLRSQIAGIKAARERISEIIAQYGVGVINSVMERMIDDCSATVSKRLLAIPDGEWRERVYVGGAAPGDAAVHQIECRIVKKGDLVICSNEGTDGQISSGNCTYGAWRSGLICALGNMLAYDQMGCPAGVLRHMRFAPQPGAMNCARHPAAVTTLTANGMSLIAGSIALGKMLLSGPQSISRNIFTSGAAGGGFWMLRWRDADGRLVTNLTGDGMTGATGATATRDGVDQGGAWFTPANVAGDIEEWEEAMPILYLTRANLIDSGGPGLRRGGNGAHTAIIPHKVDRPVAQIVSVDSAIVNTLGLGGGMPGRSGGYSIAAADHPLSWLGTHGTSGTAPAERLHPRATREFEPGEVLLVEYAGSGGIGDPLDRDPEAVARDVTDALVSPAKARDNYGVVLGTDGGMDPDATTALRAKVRQGRLDRARPAPLYRSRRRNGAGKLRVVAPGLGLAVGDDHDDWVCLACDHSIGPGDRSYKDGCAVLTAAPHVFDPARFADPARFGEVAMEVRQYLCPGCGSSLAIEFCRAHDAPLHDIHIDLTSKGSAPDLPIALGEVMECH